MTRTILSFLCLAALAAAAPESVVYRTTPQGELRINIYRPATPPAAKPHSALVLFFGGGFVNGSPAQFDSKARYLAGRGILVATAEYRIRSLHKTSSRESVEDCRAAVGWLRRNASLFNIDPSRIGAGGGSAGGGCALATAFSPNPSERPDALVLYNPVTDMARFGAPELSPLDHVSPELPPMTIFFGTDDATYLPPARTFASRCWKHGVRADLWLAPGAGHGFFNDRPASQGWHFATLFETDRFLASLGWLAGMPTLPQPDSRLQRAPRIPESARIIEALTYARTPQRNLQLDLYLPGGVQSPPLVLWVHGGAWMGGSRANPPAYFLLDHGYAVASISYRLSQDAVFPAQIHDVKAAVVWLRANAANFGFDARKIAAWGSSAGGHLVALLGVSAGVRALEADPQSGPELSRVQAVVDFFGPSDLLTIGNYPSDIAHFAPGSPESRLLGGPVLENKDKARLASPVSYVDSSDPPFLIVHGDADMTVPHNQSLRLHDALRKAGVPSELITLPNAGHGGPAFNAPGTANRILAFLNTVLRP